MKRILFAAALLALSTSAFADAEKWRSPFTSAPTQTPVSPLDAEKQAKVMNEEMQAWNSSGHRWHVSGFRSAEAPRARYACTSNGYTAVHTGVTGGG